MNGTKKTKGYSCCTVNKCKMENVDIQSRLIKKVLKNKAIRKPTYMKLIQVMAFCSMYLSPSSLYEKLADAHFTSLLVPDENKLKFEDLFASIL
jgi:hypothetical protein